MTFQSMFNLKGKRFFRLTRKDDEGLITYSLLTPSFFLFGPFLKGVNIFYKNLEYVVSEIIKDGYKIDLIHAHSFLQAGVCATRLAKKLNIPIITTEHSSGIIKGTLPKNDIKLLKETVISSDRFICVSQHLKDTIISLTGISNNVLVIPNLVDDRFFYKEKDESKEIFKFISIGNLIRTKRFDLLITSFARAFKNNNFVKLEIVGDGCLRKELIHLVQELDIQSKVTFTGKVSRDDVANHLNSSNAFVLVSDHETFGVVYIEALACGLPIIATKNGGADDIVNNSNGLFINTNDMHALEESLINMYNNSSKFNRKTISVDCKNRYGSDIIAEALSKLYADVISEYH